MVSDGEDTPSSPPLLFSPPTIEHTPPAARNNGVAAIPDKPFTSTPDHPPSHPAAGVHVWERERVGVCACACVCLYTQTYTHTLFLHAHTHEHSHFLPHAHTGSWQTVCACECMYACVSASCVCQIERWGAGVEYHREVGGWGRVPFSRI